MTNTADLRVDPVLAGAVEIAREVLAEDVPADSIGDHLQVVAEAELVATHLFACTNPGYVGWQWAVNVTRLADSDVVTVNETILLPGNDSLLPPTWVPWNDRIQAGDLGVGDVLPTDAADQRLVPGYTEVDLDITEDDDLRPVLWELGLGRVRVLSPFGRDEAATRWASGPNGPDSPIAKAASEQCISCGFLVTMNGPLGQAFGLCANEFSPSDGQVVTLDHGCGAHSEAEPEPPPIAVVELVVDDFSSDRLDTTELSDDDLDDTDTALIDALEDDVEEFVAELEESATPTAVDESLAPTDLPSGPDTEVVADNEPVDNETETKS